MRKMDEMELLIALKSAKIAWIYTVVATEDRRNVTSYEMSIIA